jgi:hypothetical protein
MPYIGGKSQAGVYQRIISLIPPHAVYIEPFAGSFAIGRIKKPAKKNIAIDKDERAVAALPPGVERITGCGLTYLESYPWRGDEFVYLDPPYVLAARGGRRYYRHELSDDDHRWLLRIVRWLTNLGVRVMLSGYPSELYHGEGFGIEPIFLLPGWDVETFEVMTRGHKWRTECVWFNFPRPVELHDHSHVGADRRARWNIERRRRRWRSRLEAMQPLERATLFAALVDVMGRDAIAAAASESGVAGS